MRDVSGSSAGTMPAAASSGSVSSKMRPFDRAIVSAVTRNAAGEGPVILPEAPARAGLPGGRTGKPRSSVRRPGGAAAPAGRRRPGGRSVRRRDRARGVPRRRSARIARSSPSASCTPSACSRSSHAAHPVLDHRRAREVEHDDVGLAARRERADARRRGRNARRAAGGREPPRVRRRQRLAAQLRDLARRLHRAQHRQAGAAADVGAEPDAHAAAATHGARTRSNSPLPRKLFDVGQCASAVPVSCSTCHSRVVEVDAVRVDRRAGRGARGARRRRGSRARSGYSARIHAISRDVLRDVRLQPACPDARARAPPAASSCAGVRRGGEARRDRVAEPTAPVPSDRSAPSTRRSRGSRCRAGRRGAWRSISTLPAITRMPRASAASNSTSTECACTVPYTAPVVTPLRSALGDVHAAPRRGRARRRAWRVSAGNVWRVEPVEQRDAAGADDGHLRIVDVRVDEPGADQRVRIRGDRRPGAAGGRARRAPARRLG